MADDIENPRRGIARSWSRGAKHARDVETPPPVAGAGRAGITNEDSRAILFPTRAGETAHFSLRIPIRLPFALALALPLLRSSVRLLRRRFSLATARVGAPLSLSRSPPSLSLSLSFTRARARARPSP